MRLRIVLYSWLWKLHELVEGGFDLVVIASSCEGWVFKPEVFGWFDFKITKSTETGPPFV